MSHLKFQYLGTVENTKFSSAVVSADFLFGKIENYVLKKQILWENCSLHHCCEKGKPRKKGK